MEYIEERKGVHIWNIILFHIETTRCRYSHDITTFKQIYWSQNDICYIVGRNSLKIQKKHNLQKTEEGKHCGCEIEGRTLSISVSYNFTYRIYKHISLPNLAQLYRKPHSWV